VLLAATAGFGRVTRGSVRKDEQFGSRARMSPELFGVEQKGQGRCHLPANRCCVTFAVQTASRATSFRSNFIGFDQLNNEFCLSFVRTSEFNIDAIAPEIGHERRQNYAVAVRKSKFLFNALPVAEIHDSRT
jgi:hypothetical protein